MTLVRTREAAQGKWRGILMQLGVPENYLHNRHGPCPLCGGKDRFRWDNKDGRGSFICNQCGAGDGLNLTQRYLGLSFPEAAQRIDDLIGNVELDRDRRQPAAISEDELRRRCRKLFKMSRHIQPGDLVATYLGSRGLPLDRYPENLRFAPQIYDGEGGKHPAMLAMVGLPAAPKHSSIHRTFLMPGGSAKASLGAPRKLMKDSRLPAGACVSLSKYEPGTPLGIAEGIETALAASAMFNLPVWAALNATMLNKWCPPGGCTEVHIFADNDRNFAGQIAANELAKRLNADGIDVVVHTPPKTGHDWADEWLECPNRKLNERILFPWLST